MFFLMSLGRLQFDTCVTLLQDREAALTDEYTFINFQRFTFVSHL
jgi:hypothetical protein